MVTHRCFQLSLSSAVCSQGHPLFPTALQWGHRGPGGDAMRTADPAWPKGHSVLYDMVGKESLERGASWASVRSGEHLCASLVTYLHIRTVITVSLFLFSILISSFISAQKFYLVFVPPVLLWEWGGSEQPSGAEPPSRLNHNDSYCNYCSKSFMLIPRCTALLCVL